MAAFSTNLDTGNEEENTTFLRGAAEISPKFSVCLKLIEWEKDLKAESIEDVSWNSRDLISNCQSDLTIAQFQQVHLKRDRMTNLSKSRTAI